ENARSPLSNTAVACHRLCGRVSRANSGEDVQLDRGADCLGQVERINRLKQTKRGSFATRLRRSRRNSCHTPLLGFGEDNNYISANVVGNCGAPTPEAFPAGVLKT